jgi:hypothetical protein
MSQVASTAIKISNWYLHKLKFHFHLFFFSLQRIGKPFLCFLYEYHNTGRSRRLV